MKSFLIDASSIIVLIRKAGGLSAECLHKSVILDLTFYELGNALWKDTIIAKFATSVESQALTKLTQNMLTKIEQIKCEVETFQAIFEMAQKEKLSFYDSSYLWVAKQNGLILVTEDKELSVKGQKYVDVRNAEAFLKS